MHPILFHFGRLAIPTAGVLTACGLLAGLQIACLLARRSGVAPDRVWNLCLTALLTYFLGERMLVIAFNLRDFIAHPVWMLGLATIRDQRYLTGAMLLGICAGFGYISAWRLPWRSVLDAIAPGAGVALACAGLGSFAVGADFGREASARWGVVYTSRLAGRLSGTPLGVPLIPVTLYAAAIHLLLAAAAAWLQRRARRPGVAAAFWLFAAGLATVLLGQLRYSTAAEVLIGGSFTEAQVAGVLAVAASAVLAFRPAPLRQAVGPASPADAPADSADL